MTQPLTPGPVVGLAGIGRMGAAMARSIARAGRPLVLWNRSLDKAAALAAELAAAGATVRVAATPALVAAQADIVLTMLADDAAVQEVYAGPDGLIGAARAGQVLVDLSTITPATIRGLEAAVRARGAGLLDSPVSGSTALAESGGLTLMVGGDGGGPRARAAGPRAARQAHLPPRPAGRRRGHEARRQHRDLRPQRGARGGAAARRAAGIAIADAYEVIANSAVGAPFVGYKRAAFVEPDTTPGRVRGRPRAQGPAAHRASWPPRRASPCRRRDANRAVLQAASDAGLRRRRLLRGRPSSSGPRPPPGRARPA